VDHPLHYGGNSIYETIKVIEAWGLGYHLGNAVKYISRAGKKGDRLEDLRKAAWYLNRAIELAEPLDAEPPLIRADPLADRETIIKDREKREEQDHAVNVVSDPRPRDDQAGPAQMFGRQEARGTVSTFPHKPASWLGCKACLDAAQRRANPTGS
jgi:hypothetical protein